MLLLGALLLASPALAGPLRLEVDARRATRQTLHARLEVPVQPGPLTLVYPTWLPGEHGPTGPVFNLTGLRFTAAGRPLAWTRDPVDLATFRLAVPDGATSLQAELDFLIRRAASSAADARPRTGCWC